MYKYYGYQNKKGAILIERATVDYTEMKYWSGMEDFDTAWNAKETKLYVYPEGLIDPNWSGSSLEKSLHYGLQNFFLVRSSDSLEMKSGYFICPDGVNITFPITGLGFRPKAIHFYGTKLDGVHTWFHSSQGFADAYGNQNVSTFTGNWSLLNRGDMKLNACVYLIDSGGGQQILADLISMDANGFTLHFTKGSSAFGVMYEAIG